MVWVVFFFWSCRHMFYFTDTLPSLYFKGYGGKKKPYYFIGYFKKIISSIKKYTSTKNNRLSQVKKVP